MLRDIHTYADLLSFRLVIHIMCLSITFGQDHVGYLLAVVIDDHLILNLGILPAVYFLLLYS